MEAQYLNELESSIDSLISIGKELFLTSYKLSEYSDNFKKGIFDYTQPNCEFNTKKAESLTTHQPPKLHPEVQRLLQFETIYNLYYPEAVSQLEATTVEEFNQNTDNNIENVHYYCGDDYESMVVRLWAYAVVILGDVYFRRGKFQPESEEGRKLLTHELTHVAQNKNKEFVDLRTREELEEEAEFNFQKLTKHFWKADKERIENKGYSWKSYFGNISL